MKNPEQELARARQALADVLEALEIPQRYWLPLTAACESVAKARAVVAVAQFVEARQLRGPHPGDGIGPN